MLLDTDSWACAGFSHLFAHAMTGAPSPHPPGGISAAVATTALANEAGDAAGASSSAPNIIWTLAPLAHGGTGGDARAHTSAAIDGDEDAYGARGFSRRKFTTSTTRPPAKQ